MYGRRKRQEVSGKVGEAPSHLLPVSAPPSNTHMYPYGTGHANPQQNALYTDDQRGQQWQHPQGPQQGQPFAFQQQQPPPDQSTYTAPPAVFAGAVGPIPPPDFNYGGDCLMPSAMPTQPTTSGTYNRDIRSAGPPPSANNLFGPPSQSPRGLPGAPNEMQPGFQQQQQQAYTAATAAPQAGSPIDMPLYGRRAHTTDVTGRDQAKEQRQLEYQREIAAQAEQARERKRLEKERIKREDDALEQRVVEDRMKLANKEREEREKEVRDRDEKEAAALGGAKRRGGNHQPPQSNVSDHQRELLQQIEERKQRKQAEEDAKLRDDLKYERKFNPGGAPSAGLAVDAAPAGFPGPSSSAGRSQGGPSQASTDHAANPFQGAGGASPPLASGAPSWMPHAGSTGANSFQQQQQLQQYGGGGMPDGGPRPYGGGHPYQPPTAMSNIKDEIFSMLVDHHRQQTSHQPPPPEQYPPFSLSSPQYTSSHGAGQAPPYNNNYGGIGGAGAGAYGRQQSISQPFRPQQQQPSASTAQSVYGMQGMYGAGGGGGYYGGGAGGGGFGAGHPQVSGGLPFGGGPGGPMFPHAPLSYQPMQQQHQPTPNEVLQRFVEEDLRGSSAPWTQHQSPSEDVSLELPGEPSKFLGRRDGGGRRR